MQLRRKDTATIEMQMGPMIDMVFLLLVFFMVTARPVKQESDISMDLPGTAATQETFELPDEQRIVIRADGNVELNEMAVDSATSRDLPGLLQTLRRYKEAADAGRAQALVTLDPEDQSQHQRIVDVLNVCAKAGIQGVTFAAATEEGETL